MSCTLALAFASQGQAGQTQRLAAIRHLRQLAQKGQGLGAIGICVDVEAFRLERHGNRRQDVLIVVNERYGLGQ